MNKITNKPKLYFTFLVSILLFFSCDHCNNQEFTIFYYRGEIEFLTRVECTDLERSCIKAEYDDTIFIESAIAEQIKNAIVSAKPAKHDYGFNSLIYVDMGDLALCLNGIDSLCWIRQGDKEYFPSILSNEVVFLLKWKSKYYNYFSYDELEYDKGIQQYGIPSDYKKEEEVIENVSNIKITSKILVKVK